MNYRWIRWVLPLLLATVGVAVFSIWIGNYLTFQVAPRLPGSDNRPVAAVSADGGPKTGSLETFDGKPSTITAAWPAFRGAQYDAVSKETAPLISQFPPEGPKSLWQVELGEGYAAPAIWHGRIYLIDYDMVKLADAIRCFSLDDGKEIWRYSYPVKVKRNHGMSRTVPAVADGFVVTIGPKCHVVCLNAESGQLIWSLDLVQEYGSVEPLWYAGQCPRIENGKAILAPAGSSMMIAVECATGRVLWKADNPDKWKMTHSSVLPMEFAGRRMYVYPASGGVVGIDAETGQTLWKTDQWKLNVNVPTPVDLGDGKILLSAGYNYGSAILQLQQSGESFVPEIILRLKAIVFGADQQTPIFYQGYIYGIRPDKQLVCMDLSGNILWNSGIANKYGLGPYIIADDKIIVLDDGGLLSLIEAKPDKFNLLSQSRVLDGHDCWGPLALVQGRLLVRDLTMMSCIHISAE